MDVAVNQPPAVACSLYITLSRQRQANVHTLLDNVSRLATSATVDATSAEWCCEYAEGSKNIQIVRACYIYKDSAHMMYNVMLTLETMMLVRVHIVVVYAESDSCVEYQIYCSVTYK